MHKRKSASRVLLFALIFFLAAPAQAQSPVRQETVIFGTRVALTIAGADAGAANAAINAVFNHLNEQHERFHFWRAGELFRINQRISQESFPIALKPSMSALMRQAQAYTRASEGLFDPGIGRLISLWGFDSEVLPVQPPPPQRIADLLAQKPTIAALKLADNRIVAGNAAVQLDFGGLVKGASLDSARKILTGRGIKNALLDIGGNIAALGKKHNAFWKVAITPDRRKPPLAVINLYDGEAIATSGTAERYFVDAAQNHYHHIIDPRSGYPARAVTAATVISYGEHAGALSDAAATALVIADKKQALRILENFNIKMMWRAGENPTAAMRQRIRER